MRTEIELGKWKVKRIDRLNWQVFELREVKQEGRGKGAGTNRKGETDWMACPAFFAKPEHALEWIYDQKAADMGLRKSLKDAVAQMRCIRTQLVNELREALS